MKQKTNSLRALALTFITLSGLSANANAAAYIAEYKGIVDTSTIDGAVSSDVITYQVTMDNGGTSALSQTWNLSDVQSVRFLAGTIDVSFNLTAGSNTGSFTTDGSGVLTAVAKFHNLQGIISTNILTRDYNFFINANNSVFHINSYTKYVSEDNVENNQVASNWTLTAVPEPSSIALFGLGVIGCALRRRK